MSKRRTNNLRAALRTEREAARRYREALEASRNLFELLRGHVDIRLVPDLDRLIADARAALAPSPGIPAAPSVTPGVLDRATVEACARQVELAGVCEQCSHVGCVAARQAKRRILALAAPLSPTPADDHGDDCCGRDSLSDCPYIAPPATPTCATCGGTRYYTILETQPGLLPSHTRRIPCPDCRARNCSTCIKYLKPRWDCPDCKGTGRCAPPATERACPEWCGTFASHPSRGPRHLHPPDGRCYCSRECMKAGHPTHPREVKP